MYFFVTNNCEGVVGSCERSSSNGWQLDANPCICNDCRYSRFGVFQIQSDVLIESGGSAASVQQETTQFIDESVGLKVGIDEGYDGISALDQTETTDLAKFLMRPVRISSFTWNESDAIGTTHTIAPWNLFFTDTRVKYKMNNFAFIQCDLKVKVLINASPFYYGAMIGAYQPASGITPSTIVNDTGTRWFIPLSQRPHMWILPQGSKADEMTLPFFYHKNFLDLQSASDMTAMGSMDFVNYTALASANGAVGVGVSVQVYAWAENVKLSGPSIGLSVQSDEYGQGVISAPATAIANGAKWFENIPIIGRFATATRIGAGAISSIASLFGFTNVPNIGETDSYRPVAFPQLATTSISYPAEKLTLDPKNELTIDPSVLGLPSVDEMVISNLIQRESYLATASWTGVNAVDDILFSTRISNSFYDNDSGANSKAYMTPMTWISHMFNGWRGDIILRFKFIATPYHKGRVRLSYDPSGYTGENIYDDAVSQNVVQTVIVDLGEESDVEFRIPYQQATSFQQTRTGLSAGNIGWSLSTSPTFSINKAFDNGSFTMRVQTNLTSPIATTNVPILIFVRAAENFEFAMPRQINTYAVAPFVVQSDVYGDPLTITAGRPSNAHPERYLINYGESVKSLRQLLRRQSLTFNIGNALNTTDNSLLTQFRFGRYPMYYGYDPNGFNTALGIVDPESIFPFNYSHVTPYNWVAAAFIAQRGSMQWTFNVDTTTPVRHVRVYRDGAHSSSAALTSIALAAKGSQSVQSHFYKINCDSGAGGQALTSQQTNAGLTVQLPSYTKYRWNTTSPAQTTALTPLDGLDIDSFVLEVHTAPSSEIDSSEAATTWCYSGIGTDFGLYFFLNVPVMWLYSAIPTPV